MMKNMIFNSVSEVGLRAMFLLEALNPEKVDLDRLNYFDYLMLYTDDGEGDMESLHPEYPLMLIELFSKKQMLKESLLYIGSKSLISIQCTERGISYSANSNTSWFLESLFNNEYAKKLMKRSQIVNKEFSSYTNGQLKELIEIRAKDSENKFENLFPYNVEDDE